MARNESMFKGKIFHWVEIVELAIYRASLWVKAKFEDIPYSTGEFRRNIDVVRRCKDSASCRIDRGVVVWVPSIHGWMKFNVDESSLGKPGAVAISGVLRDDGGCFKCIFLESIGVVDSNVVEFMAIRKALRVFVDSESAGSSKLIVKSDSMVAVAWVLGKESIPWKLRFVYNEIKFLLSCISGVSFINIFRKQNMVADQLAKSGITRSIPLIAWL
ncbi:hypothetical protein L1049_023028 [Liquidambar formosana]|uniref:RNase H type-1 domain-containing protein n=1 Tax=Liquidambar formosana TaxID=63359 RepID=A0AAP0RDX2_LIQFO